MKPLSRMMMSIAFLSCAACADDLLDAVLNTPLVPPPGDPAPAVSVGVSDSVGGGKPEAAPPSLRPVQQSVPQETHGRNNQQGEVRELGLPEPSAFSSDHIKNPATFSIRGGGGDGSIAANLEYRKPLGKSAFDLSIRGFFAETTKSGSYDYYTYSKIRRTECWKETQTDGGGEALLLWVPFRGRILEPFAGIGARYEYARYKYDGRRMSDYDDDIVSGACLAGRLGLKLNLGRVFLTGEYIAGGKVGDFDGTSELIGDIGFYLTRRMSMHLFVDSINMDVSSGTAVGGGLSFDF